MVDEQIEANIVTETPPESVEQPKIISLGNNESGSTIVLEEDDEHEGTNGALSMSTIKPGDTKLEQVETKKVTWEEFPDSQSMRAHIFSVADIKEELIDIPEWGMQILVRGLNAKTRATILQNAMNKDGSPNMVKMYPDLVTATARHPTLKTLIFSPADRDALNEKSGGVLERLAMAAARLSGLDANAQEVAVQNFQAAGIS